MDSVDSRFLHVWYLIDSVDGTGRTNGIVNPVIKTEQVNLSLKHTGNLFH